MKHTKPLIRGWVPTKSLLRLEPKDYPGYWWHTKQTWWSKIVFRCVYTRRVVNFLVKKKLRRDK